MENNMREGEDLIYGKDHKIELEDYDTCDNGSGSDSGESYTSESWESDNVEEELEGIRVEADGVQPTLMVIKSQASKPRQDLITLDEEDEEIGSEEEKDIMREIKDEIQNQVREEMKSELKLYKAKMESLDHGGSTKTSEEKDETIDMEPKLREAYIKMRKLDRVLAKKVRREKEVKKDRILLERRIREEISNLKPEGREFKEVVANTEKFIQLALPASHNEGLSAMDLECEPVFTTQLGESQYQHLNRGKNKASRTGRAGSSASPSATPHSLGSNGENMPTSGCSTTSSHGRKKKKNFIKRNIQLAGDADNAIAMTDEEKLRIDELLCDLDTLPGTLEDIPNAWDETNVQSLVIHPGEGFQPEADELQSLAVIDSRLKILMPPTDYESMISSCSSLQNQPSLFCHTDEASSVDFNHFGEQALHENKEQRDMNDKLRRIEEELAKLHNPEEMEIDTPRLEEDQLKDLLNQCLQSLSRTSYLETESEADRLSSVDLNTPRTDSSLNLGQSILENPPKLPQSVLQKLLSEAYCPLSSRLATLQEETEVGDCKYDGTDELTAETWKIIAEEKSDEEDVEIESIMSEPSTRCPSFSNSRNALKSDLLRSKNENSISQNDYSQSICDTQTLFLPEINLSGSLTAQNNNCRQTNRTNNITAKSAVELIRSSFCSPDVDLQGDGQQSEHVAHGSHSSPVPQPPAGNRKHSSGTKNKSRNVTPLL